MKYNNFKFSRDFDHIVVSIFVVVVMVLIIYDTRIGFN